MNRNASALWKGNLHEGEGTLTTESGVLSKTQYSFRTRFAEGLGTNPDELIAAREVEEIDRNGGKRLMEGRESSRQQIVKEIADVTDVEGANLAVI